MAEAVLVILRADAGEAEQPIRVLKEIDRADRRVAMRPVVGMIDQVHHQAARAENAIRLAEDRGNDFGRDVLQNGARRDDVDGTGREAQAAAIARGEIGKP